MIFHHNDKGRALLGEGNITGILLYWLFIRLSLFTETSIFHTDAK